MTTIEGVSPGAWRPIERQALVNESANEVIEIPARGKILATGAESRPSTAVEVEEALESERRRDAEEVWRALNGDDDEPDEVVSSPEGVIDDEIFDGDDFEIVERTVDHQGREILGGRGMHRP